MRHLGKVQAALAVVVVAGFLAACWIVWTVPPADSAMRDVALMLLGALAGQFVGVCQWYFGSSAGSARKDAALMAEAPHVITAPKEVP